MTTMPEFSDDELHQEDAFCEVCGTLCFGPHIVRTEANGYAHESCVELESPHPPMVDCGVCGMPIDILQDPHFLHEEDCPKRTDPSSQVTCLCPDYCHEDCCPTCNLKVT